MTPNSPTLEQVLPQWDFAETHSLQVPDLSPETIAPHIDPALRAPDRWFALAIGLRELPGRIARRLGHASVALPNEPFGLHSFTRLTPDQDALPERLYGLAGKFWRLDYGLLDVANLDAYMAITDQPKLALDVRAIPDRQGGTRLETRTRIHCPTPESKRQFTPYWYLIRPVSGGIRRRMLGKIVAAARLAQTS
ncbi:hypothetical protein [Hydrogenophaga sp. 5NK40-0174]|uniref:hypothetical protein n=1 Tax=Hydrogenophaga sp. 5NK40-0174 TaxID=3127649 RepID=UPI00310303AE